MRSINPVVAFQVQTELSYDTLTTRAPSYENATDFTVRVAAFQILADVSFELLTTRVLSLENAADNTAAG